MSVFRVFSLDAGAVFGDNKGAMKMQSTTTKYHAHAPLLGEVTSSDCVFMATGKGSFISGGVPMSRTTKRHPVTGASKRDISAPVRTAMVGAADLSIAERAEARRRAVKTALRKAQG